MEAAPAGAPGVVSVRLTRTSTTAGREVSGRGREGAARWQILARRRTGGPNDDARWNLAMPAGAGRLILGSQVRLAPVPDRRGWTGALATRRAPPGPSPSLARTGNGISWELEGLRRLRAAAGRDADGEAVAQVAAGAAGWLAAAGIRAGQAVTAAGWGGSAGGVPFRAEAYGSRRNLLVRAAVGGDGTGILAEWDARRPGERATALKAGARVESGPFRGLWMEGAVRAGASRARPFEVGWARRGAEWGARLRVVGQSAGGATWRAAAERGVPGAGTVAVTLDGDAGPRPDSVRGSWRVTGRAARAGVTLELPATRPRSASAFADVPAGRGVRLTARGRWAVGRRAAFDLEWTLPLPGGRRRSTR